MFSQTTEYALRAMVFLARQSGQPHTTHAIAEVTKVPSDYLAKVLKELGRAGLVTSQRGLGGGFRLVRDPYEILVYDVVQAVSAVPRIRECPLGLEAHAEKLCPMHQLLDDAMAQIETAFRATSLGQLVEGTDPYADLNIPANAPADLRISATASSDQPQHAPTESSAKLPRSRRKKST